MDYHYYDEPDYIDYDGGSSEVLYHDQEEQLNHYQAHHNDYNDNDKELVGSMERLWDTYDNCILPSLHQVLGYIMPLLLGCLLCRLLSALYTKRQLSGTGIGTVTGFILAPLHLINALCGMGMLYVTLGDQMLLLLLLSSVSYILLQLVRLGNGERAAIFIAVLSIGSQFIYELAIWQQRDDWPQLRGLQMVVNMKVISLAFDLSVTGAAGMHMPNILAYFGYIFNPSSCVLGPWLSYLRYLDSLRCKPNWRRGACQMLLNILLCLLTLTVSNCVAPALGEFHLHTDAHGQDVTRNNVLLMYMGALSVRSSHYFVSFLSQGLLAAAGQQLDTTQQSSSKLLGELVARPWHIEWPRSLSALVRCWNIPMHEWLKRYVYAASKQRSHRNTIIAVFCTYLVSSLLHGMDLRIYLVLLSLATFAEGETMLRRHLAKVFNACVAANPCQGPERCRYYHCPQRRGYRCGCSSWLVTLANLAFTLLDIFHLAYLGIVLLNETLFIETDMDNELSFMYHWEKAGYLSHYIGIGMFIFYLFIS